MKYINAKEVLPENLIKEIHKHVDGAYIYIPKKESNKKEWGEDTNFRREMHYRNQHIFEKFLEGVELSEIADCYHLSVKSIRRIILEQKRNLEDKRVMIRELLKEWGIMCEPIQIYHSAWEINDKYVLKEYDDENILERNIEIINILGKEQIPVPKVVKSQNGSEFISCNKKHYVLTTKLKGKNIVNIDECVDKWFFEFGCILAKLHLAFLKCEEEIDCWHNSLLGEMNSWVKENLLKYQPEYLEIEDYENAISELEKVYDILPKQLIHRDVHLGNFLFSDGKFSGYIDFDLSQINIRIFDVCYFLLGLLLEDDENHIKEDKWYGIVRQVVKGYDKEIELSATEKNSITCVMKNIELLFVAYFLGIGDEKSAEDSAKLFYFVKNNEEKIKNWLQ